MATESQAAEEALEALEHHYVAHLGPCQGKAPWRSRRGDIELRRFEPVAGTLVLATFGVSRLARQAAEAVLSLHAQPSEATLASACEILGAFADGGYNLEPPQAFDPQLKDEGVDFDLALVVPPLAFTEGLGQLRRPAPYPPLQIRWILPVYDAEAEYAESHGPQALIHLLRAQRLDVADFGRPPASTLVTPEDAARMAGAAGADAGKNYRAEQVRGGIRIERKRRKIGLQTTSTVPTAVPPGPLTSPEPLVEQPKAALRRAPIKEAPGRPGRQRFQLNPPPSPAPAKEEVAPPSARVAEDPEVARQRHIDALRAKVRAARAAAEARARGEAPRAVPVPTAPVAPNKARSVQAAGRRRGRRSPPNPRRR